MSAIISILGSTGSIGTQTLEVLEELSPKFHLRWLTTNTRIDLLEEQVLRYKPYGVVICDEKSHREFVRKTAFQGEILCGNEGVIEAASDAKNTILMSALVGFSGVLPTLAAIEQGTTIALANKETLVSAGEIITKASKQNNANILAVDSEHSAILQCLQGETTQEIEKIILTASGGPFRSKSAEELKNVTLGDALKHPNWAMGAKITIDSATLMNKGFEVIEARWLFNLNAEQIDVVIHPQSIIHSLVQFVDGSVKAQLGLPSMKIPIQYALTFPRRMPSSVQRMNLAELGSMTFFEPDYGRFPCLHLAFEAMKTGGTATAILNAANEIAVANFLSEKISFVHIPVLIERALEKIPSKAEPTLTEIIEADGEARTRTEKEIASLL